MKSTIAIEEDNLQNFPMTRYFLLNGHRKDILTFRKFEVHTSLYLWAVVFLSQSVIYSIEAEVA